ncbi:sialidase family protein [Amycolatopsis sp. NPDC049253]|uniref:sialidase family protein n=1 Tax=Amycolatopsis sp. NPDC049253 TaxID=3155274 RepID=UPI003444D932
MNLRRVARGLLAALAGATAFAAAAVVPGATPAASADAASTVVYQAGTGGYSCFRIPAIVKANNGDLLAFAEGRKNSCADTGDIDLVMKRQAKGSSTWGPLQIVIQGFGDVKGNPTPVVVPPTADEPDGRVVLLSVMQCVAPHAACGRVPRVSVSKDNGSTWAAPQVLTTQLGFTAAPGWLATGPSHASVLTRGAHKGRLVAGMSYQVNSSAPDTGAIIYSDDRGSTWHLGAHDASTNNAALNPQEISLTELPDGKIYASARNNAGTMCSTVERAYAISSDGGQTFSQKFVTEPGLAKTPDVQGSTLAMSATDTGGAYTRLIFAGPSVCDHRHALRIRSSFDEGGSWQGDTDGFLVWSQDAAYSDLVSLGTGSAGVLFEGGPQGNSSAAIRWAKFTDANLGAPACGSGYGVIDQGSLGTAGTVYLSYNAATGKNCVSTMKNSGAGTASQTTAYLQVQGGTKQTDSGSYSWFAGPVTASAAGKCVTWGGSVGTTKFDAPLGHCG